MTHDVGGPASEIQGLIAVLDDGRVLFDAGFLHGSRAVSTIYWLRWDAASATLVVDKSATFSSEMSRAGRMLDGCGTSHGGLATTPARSTPR